jgi:anti-sigma regulatory factor (Ser/Thr protein kinase)
VDVTLEGYDGVIDVEVADRGPFMSPAAARGLAEGGRGVPIMLALVDEVEFAQTDDGTRVRMRKRFRRRGLEAASSAARRHTSTRTSRSAKRS